MKHIIITGLLCLLLFGYSCDKALELDPSGSLPTDEALADMPSLRTALYGVYHTLQVPGYYGKDFPLLSELRGNLVYSRQKKLNPIYFVLYAYSQNNSHASAESVWNTCYKVILKSNNILHNIDRVQGDRTEKDQIRGEAQALRALAYFDLVRCYAKPYTAGNPATDPGVPIVLKSGIYEPPRNTVAEVYDRIVTDLEAARLLMKKISPYRFSPDGANALLARVHLYKGDWAKAEQLAGDIIGSGAYALADNVVALFAAPGSAEEIFTLKFEASESAGTGNFGNQYNLTGQGDVAVSKDDLLDLYEPADSRRNLIFQHTDNEYYTTKFLSQDNVAGLYSPKLLRLAEMYLIRAEARFRLDDTAGALADLNALRLKRGASEWMSLPNGILDILHERHRELAFEGHTPFDYWRTGAAMIRNFCGSPLQSGTGKPCQVPADTFLTVHAIPQAEMDANRNMVQNEGY